MKRLLLVLVLTGLAVSPAVAQFLIAPDGTTLPDGAVNFVVPAPPPSLAGPPPYGAHVIPYMSRFYGASYPMTLVPGVPRRGRPTLGRSQSALLKDLPPRHRSEVGHRIRTPRSELRNAWGAGPSRETEARSDTPKRHSRARGSDRHCEGDPGKPYSLRGFRKACNC